MIPKTIPTLSVLAIANVLIGPLHAEVKPNPLFTDGAVLQRGQPVPVWGTARDGEKVTVEIAGQKVGATAAHGKWRVNLKPLKEGGPLTMKITGDNTVTVNNLLVGEVWVCSGQSNMEWKFSQAHNPHFPALRSGHRLFQRSSPQKQIPSNEARLDFRAGLVVPGTAT